MIQNIWLHLKKLYLLEQQQQKHPAKRHMQNKQTNGYTIAPTKELLMLLALTHASSQQSQQQQLSLLLEEQQLQDETGQLESPDKQQVHLDVLQIYQPESMTIRLLMILQLILEWNQKQFSIFSNILLKKKGLQNLEIK
ncbi:hypothetical protein pb186bvf_021193 [Paramecium bursaria]